jgi:hypothetical protein
MRGRSALSTRLHIRLNDYADCLVPRWNGALQCGFTAATIFSRLSLFHFVVIGISTKIVEAVVGLIVVKFRALIVAN